MIMSSLEFLKNLNYKQKKAVSAQQGNFLLLAGAGSGKTRVLVYRIAWLLSIEKKLPCSIMAVTFTNKAAIEIRKRIQDLIGDHQNGMWIGTFHGLAHRLLRIHYQDANLPQNFQILDSDDQLRLLKRLINSMNLNRKQWSARQAMWYINQKKDEGLRPKYIKNLCNSAENIWQRIYQSYQETCDRAGLVDFSELMLRSYELWLNKPHILHLYHELFTNILVDEFQDTSKLQYNWIRKLVSRNCNIMIIGDDDQSIYSWRGARVENLQHFLDDFLNVQIIRLEQNYRSTNNILQAANTLISHNEVRLGKKLWTNSIVGEPINFYCAFNELDEASFVVNRIKVSKEQGWLLKDSAILYRNNSQSRVLEEMLLQTKIPYQIYGGISFFERQEIKDALAYLRLIANHNDDAAYERIFNTPSRGLSQRTFNVLRKTAKDQKMTLWQSSNKLLSEHKFNNRIATALKSFLDTIHALEKEIATLPLYKQINIIIKKTGLWKMYEQEVNDKNQERIENLKELINATRQFHYDYKNQSLLPLLDFLSYIALRSRESKNDTHEDAVQLMTLHSAKGLEFPQVFIIGMREGTFPSQISSNKNNQLEEERRLAYVGITRAMKKLTITYAKTSFLYGQETCYLPSRFIEELPQSCVKKIDIA